MQTGGRAGFGKMPNARPRRLLSRFLWAGGLAVTGTVMCAVAANAATGNSAQPDQTPESANGLLGSLTAAVEPLTTVVEPVASLAGSLVGGTDTLLTNELALTEGLLGEDTTVAAVVDQPLTSVTSAVGLDADTASADEQGVLSTEREVAATATDRSFDRSRATERANVVVAEDTASTELSGDAAPALELLHLLGSVDSLLHSVDELVPDVTTTGGELLSTPAQADAANPEFGTLETAEPLGAVGDVVSLLSLPLLGGMHLLDPISPLLAPLDSIVHTAVPIMATIDPMVHVADVTGLLRPAWQEPSHGASVTPLSLHHISTTSAVAAPGSSAHESRAALPADLSDSEPAVIHSSLDASQDEQSSPADTRGDIRPSLLMTPVAGITALYAGAPGAAISADQAGPSSHALLPEEAVLRARLFSAAAYARTTGAKPLREANDPPVSPD